MLSKLLLAFFSVQNQSLHIVFTILLCFVTGAGLAQDSSYVRRCDQLAGHMNDKQFLSSEPATHSSLKKNVSEALAVCQEAAKSGLARQIYQLGRAKLLADDYDAGIADYRVASDLGHANATFFLGVFHWNGSYGVSQDKAKAIDFYRRSLSEGSIAAPLTLGQISLYGWLNTSDYEEAFRLFKMAEEMGNTEVCFELGFMYQNGWHVRQNLQTAIGYYDRCILIHQTRVAASHAQIGAAALKLASKVAMHPREIREAYRKSVQSYLEAVKRAKIDELRDRSVGALHSIVMMQRAASNAVVRDAADDPDLRMHWSSRDLLQVVAYAESLKMSLVDKTQELSYYHTARLDDREWQILQDVITNGKKLAFAVNALEEILNEFSGQRTKECVKVELDTYYRNAAMIVENDCDYAVEVKGRVTYFRRNHYDSALQKDVQETKLEPGSWDTVDFEESYSTYDDMRVELQIKICPASLGFGNVYWSSRSNNCNGTTPLSNDSISKAYYNLDKTLREAINLLGQ